MTHLEAEACAALCRAAIRENWADCRVDQEIAEIRDVIAERDAITAAERELQAEIRERSALTQKRRHDNESRCGHLLTDTVESGSATVSQCLLCDKMLEVRSIHLS